MLVTNKLTPFLQVTSNDSIKCFTYSEARQIIADLRKLPVKDSIINRLDSIIVLNDTIIKKHEFKITEQRENIQLKELRIKKLKGNRKIFVIFGALLGISTQFIF